MGAYFMPGLTIVFFLFIILGMAYVILGPKHQGAWDDEAKVTAKMRQRGWKVRPKVDEVSSFLLETDIPGELWFLDAGETGVQGLSHNNWRAATVLHPQGDKLYVAIALAQQSDGRVAELEEVLIEHLNNGYEIRTVLGSTPEYLTSAVRSQISTWDAVEGLYFRGEHLVAQFATTHGESDIIERVDDYVARLIAVAQALPREVWK